MILNYSLILLVLLLNEFAWSFILYIKPRFNLTEENEDGNNEDASQRSRNLRVIDLAWCLESKLNIKVGILFRWLVIYVHNHFLIWSIKLTFFRDCLDQVLFASGKPFELKESDHSQSLTCDGGFWTTSIIKFDYSLRIHLESWLIIFTLKINKAWYREVSCLHNCQEF